MSKSLLGSLRKPTAKRGKKSRFLCHGGPFAGEYLALETEGTLEFSIKVSSKTSDTNGKLFKGYYDHNMHWISTI